MIEQSLPKKLAPDEQNAFANPQSIGDPCDERNGAAASGAGRRQFAWPTASDVPPQASLRSVRPQSFSNRKLSVSLEQFASVQT
jgi:hypothetical protein